MLDYVVLLMLTLPTSLQWGYSTVSISGCASRLALLGLLRSSRFALLPLPFPVSPHSVPQLTFATACILRPAHKGIKHHSPPLDQHAHLDQNAVRIQTIYDVGNILCGVSVRGPWAINHITMSQGCYTTITDLTRANPDIGNLPGKE